MAVTRIFGGLGNQLFQFFGGLYFSRKHQKTIILDLSWFSRFNDINSKISKREFGLGCFNLITCVETWDNPVGQKLIEGLVRRSAHSQRIKEFLGIIDDTNSHTIETFNVTNGYFQSIEFFPDISEMESLMRLREPSSWFKSIRREIELCKPIALHVRMGDFKYLPNLKNVCDLEYYAQSVNFVKDKVGDHPIWLFSDEPVLAKLWLEKIIRIDRVVSSAKYVTAAESMIALGNSHSIVTSNSTFSWWAGFYGAKFARSKLVVQPQRFENASVISPQLQIPSIKCYTNNKGHFLRNKDSE